MQDIIKIENLNYADVFNNFNVNFQEKKLIFISGPNNSGKTTLVKILNRELECNNVTIFNQPIQEYKIIDFYKVLRAIVPGEALFINDTVEDEINYYISGLFLNKEQKNRRLRNIYKNLGLNRIRKEEIKKLSDKDIVRLQIANLIASMPKIMVIDDLSSYFSKEECLKLVQYFKEIITKYDTTIILTTNRLDETINADYLYIINHSEIILEGKPLEILKKDNILNKIGLRVPFMIDLSVKLKDYDLIDNIELDMNRMINLLWK